MIGQLLRFGGVGALSTLAHVATAIAAERWLELDAQQANLMGFFAAVTLSYVGHARITFRARVGSTSQIQRFVLLSLLGLATSSSTVWLIDGVLGLGFVWAMAVVAVLVPAATYLAMRFWVFGGSEGARPSWQGVAIAALIVLAMPLVFRGQALTNDVTWYLIATRDWLAGAPLYDWIMEVNPPLNFYYTVPAILMADLLGISDAAGQYLVVWLLLFLILIWCAAIIRADFALSSQRQAILLVGVAFAILIPSLDSIAQREFYLVVLMMPWLLCQVSPSTPSPWREGVTALVAALGVCLKPNFVLFPLAVILVRCVRDRSLRPVLSVANLTFLLVGLAYVALVVIVHPAYLSEVVPIAQLVYGAYSAEPMVVAGIALEETLLLLLPVAMALLSRERVTGIYPFTAVCIAGLLSYLVQAKGFAYHMIPFLSFGLLACFLILIRLRKVTPFAVATALSAAGVTGLSISEGFPANFSADQINRVGQDLGGFDSLMVLTPHVYAGPPAAFASGADWVSRYPANWLVPGALNRLAKTDCQTKAALCARLQAIVDRNRSENIADMIAGKPDLLVVDLESEYFDTPRFDWLAFMAKDPAWAAVFAQYRYADKTKRYMYFQRIR